MERAPPERESPLALAPLVGMQAVTSSADDSSNPMDLLKAAFLYRIKFPFDAGEPALEIQLCAEDESVFRFAGAIGLPVEYSALEIEGVLQVPGEYPIQAGCPGFRFAARAGGYEIEFE